MIETLLDFSGLEDISRDLQLLSGAENNRVLREATRAGANVLKEEVVSRAPVRRGKLRRNVVVLSRRSRDGGMESGVHIRGVNPDTGNSDNTMKADNPRNAFYWRFVEMGTVNMPPHPFVRPAFDVRSEQAAQVAIARMNRAIDEVLRRWRRRICILIWRILPAGRCTRMWSPCWMAGRRLRFRGWFSA